MDTGPERQLLARGHELAGIEDLAGEVTGILGGARAARLDPDALPGLAGAALTLGADSLSVYRADGERFADDSEFLAAVEEADAGLAGRLKAAAALRTEARTALDNARDGRRRARIQLAAARAMTTRRPCGGCHPAKAAAITAAQTRIAESAERTGYCRSALDILDPLITRLRKAVILIRRVPATLSETYEEIYDHRAHGRVMPKDGNFITGETAKAG